MVRLHPDGSLQISLECLPAPAGDLNMLLDRIDAETRVSCPALHCARMASDAVVGMALTAAAAPAPRRCNPIVPAQGLRPVPALLRVSC